jgi:hypothetical protein
MWLKKWHNLSTQTLMQIYPPWWAVSYTFGIWTRRSPGLAPGFLVCSYCVCLSPSLCATCPSALARGPNPRRAHRCTHWAAGGGRRRHIREPGTMSAAAIAERRFLQQQRCRILYRKSLKCVLDWAVHRDIFYIEVCKKNSLPSFSL